MLILAIIPIPSISIVSELARTYKRDGLTAENSTPYLKS